MGDAEPIEVRILNTIEVAGQVSFRSPAQAPLPGAKVSLQTQGDLYEGLSDDQGAYSIQLLAADEYRLR